MKVDMVARAMAICWIIDCFYTICISTGSTARSAQLRKEPTREKVLLLLPLFYWKCNLLDDSKVVSKKRNEWIAMSSGLAFWIHLGVVLWDLLFFLCSVWVVRASKLFFCRKLLSYWFTLVQNRPNLIHERKFKSFRGSLIAIVLWLCCIRLC